MSKFWLTPGEGVLTVKDEEKRIYSNERFVNSFHSGSDSAISRLVLSSHPSPIDVRLIGDDTPPSWKEVEVEDIDIQELKKKITPTVEEPESPQRLIMPRAEISERSRKIAPFAGFSITPRGVKDDGIGDTVSEMIVRLVHSMEFIIERNTTASLKNSNRNVSPEKKSKMTRIIEILKNRENVSCVILINSYISPSPTVANRLYSIGSIYGIDKINDIVDDIYYEMFTSQLTSVLGLEEIL